MGIRYFSSLFLKKMEKSIDVIPNYGNSFTTSDRTMHVVSEIVKPVKL
ncbi:hypothetical protein MTBBW1_550018 [Desulfamplus magnetovallimortis]|uniref:Uncharacterized protein n=1 Tax=Desulfamplus magnetovallimortis TaxID=1246637 RepID=A0A1W1HI71_9BACT|nr:hypothetical protein MTBBW1_550018 [Desulfamplus magnetovallimortis]